MVIKSTTVRLTNLRFHAYHGVLPQEKLTGGNFSVSIEVVGDICDACITDNVNDTINYAELYDIVKTEILQPSALIENVAYRIGKSIINKIDKVSSVKIELTKLNPPLGADSDGASVTISVCR